MAPATKAAFAGGGPTARKAVCAGCEAVDECLAECRRLTAMFGDPGDVWGGLTQAERRMLWRKTGAATTPS